MSIYSTSCKVICLCREAPYNFKGIWIRKITKGDSHIYDCSRFFYSNPIKDSLIKEIEQYWNCLHTVVQFSTHPVV